jgi:hypothetical protein
LSLLGGSVGKCDLTHTAFGPHRSCLSAHFTHPFHIPFQAVQLWLGCWSTTMSGVRIYGIALAPGKQISVLTNTSNPACFSCVRTDVLTPSLLATLVQYALRTLYGIGPHQSLKICAKLGVNPRTTYALRVEFRGVGVKRRILGFGSCAIGCGSYPPPNSVLFCSFICRVENLGEAVVPLRKEVEANFPMKSIALLGQHSAQCTAVVCLCPRAVL